MESAKLFFRENPFPATPNQDRYVAIGSSEQARLRLIESIDRREGPALLVGPAGTGKTILCQSLAALFRSQYDVAFLSETRICTRKALLQHLLHHLGLPYADRSEGELRLSLIDRAASGGPDSRLGVIIVVDEAHTLPSRLLEELRMMSGIVRNGSPRVQLVLAGGPSLDERLSQPRMEALSQRIGARCYLHPLGQRETGEFIRESFRRVGTNPESCIDDSAVQAVYYASNGILRLINQTMSRTLAIAESIGRTRITSELVERAWADLQQLPSPLCSDDLGSDESFETPRFAEPSRDKPLSTSGRTGKASIVEFGSLLDGSIEFSSGYQDRKPSDYSVARQSDPMAETTDYEPARTNQFELEAVSNSSAPDNDADDDIDDIDEEIDEILEEDIYAAADINSLFGDGFEDEQVIACAPSRQLPTAPPTHQDAIAFASAVSICSEEIESALHNEIVSINSDALSASMQGFQQLPAAHFDDEDLVTIEDADDVFLPFHVSKLAPASLEDEEVVVEEHPRWSDELEDCLPAGVSDITVRDDSDMLIIEDDLDIDPTHPAIPPRAPRANDSLDDETDFQAIFAKLREG